jgi:hypothetical protein
VAKKIVQDTEIAVSNVNGEDYICITDMLKAKDGDFFVTDWLRNRNTMEFLGVWERIYNPNFNYGEFATIRNLSLVMRTLLTDYLSCDKLRCIIYTSNEQTSNLKRTQKVRFFLCTPDGAHRPPLI